MTLQNLKRSIHKGVIMKKWYIRFYTQFRVFDVVKECACENIEQVRNTIISYISSVEQNYIQFTQTDETPLNINKNSIVAFEILPYAFPSITR